MLVKISKTLKPVATASITIKEVTLCHFEPDLNAWQHTLGSEMIVAYRTFEGVGEIYIDDIGTFDLPSGSLFFLKASQKIHLKCKNNKWNCWEFSFQSSNLLFFPLNKVINVHEHKRDYENIDMCFTLMEKTDYYSHMCASAYFSFLLYRWLQEWGENNHKQQAYHMAIEAIINKMHTHLNTFNSFGSGKVKQWAKDTCLSERRFRQVFKSITGTSPIQYYNTIRLQLACELLQKGSLSISDIADKLGYSSQYHFSKAFSRELGSPPSKFFL